MPKNHCHENDMGDCGDCSPENEGMGSNQNLCGRLCSSSHKPCRRRVTGIINIGCYQHRKAPTTINEFKTKLSAALLHKLNDDAKSLVLRAGDRLARGDEKGCNTLLSRAATTKITKNYRWRFTAQFISFLSSCAMKMELCLCLLCPGKVLCQL